MYITDAQASGGIVIDLPVIRSYCVVILLLRSVLLWRWKILSAFGDLQKRVSMSSQRSGEVSNAFLSRKTPMAIYSSTPYHMHMYTKPILASLKRLVEGLQVQTLTWRHKLCVQDYCINDVSPQTTSEIYTIYCSSKTAILTADSEASSAANRRGKFCFV